MVRNRGIEQQSNNINSRDHDADQTPTTRNHLYTEEELARKIKCKLEDNLIVQVRWVAMMQCKIFSTMWTELDGKLRKDPFLVEDVDRETFDLVNLWLEEHIGLPDPVVIEHPITTERKPFKFTTFEQEFFDDELEDIDDLLAVYIASNYLGVRSLYLYCAQEIARRISGKDTETMCEMLGIEHEVMTEEQKEEILDEIRKMDEDKQCSSKDKSGGGTDRDLDDTPGPSVSSSGGSSRGYY